MYFYVETRNEDVGAFATREAAEAFRVLHCDPEGSQLFTRETVWDGDSVILSPFVCQAHPNGPGSFRTVGASECS